LCAGSRSLGLDRRSHGLLGEPGQQGSGAVLRDRLAHRRGEVGDVELDVPIGDTA